MRRSAWAYISIVAGAALVLILALGAVGQWLFFSHLDLSTLLGSAVGGSLGIAIMSYWYRVNQQAQKH
jgi:formate/nitrite transporter FocA (FNT family)